ncbi:GNAT family N-acetyltransferase [Kaarinaea lacus]
MIKIIEIETQRLKLRQWRKQDWPAFAELNADPTVMQYYPRTLSTEESNAMAQRMSTLIRKQGWGFWAVEKCDEMRFIGFVGLNKPAYKLPVTPCVEIGWRLAKEYWGCGYATEAAQACLPVAFNALKLSEVYSFTSLANIKSQAVMQRIGMANTHANFEHPMIPEKHPLREHVLYKIDKSSWLQQKRRNDSPNTNN